jgi:serine/threonine-protein kinase RsbW
MLVKVDEKMKDSVSITLPSKSEYVSIARLTASVIANNIGFDIEEIEDIKVAVGEACNNAVIHGNDLDSKFNIEFKILSDKFTVEVSDNGKGFEITEYSEPDLMNPKENGLGIFIMKSLMDEVEIKSLVDTGTSIIMSKYINM